MAKRPVTQLSYEELQAEINRREKSVNQLHRRRDRLIAQLEDIDRQIAEAGGKTRHHPGRRRPKNETNLVEAMAETLKGKTLSVTELADAVQVNGYRTTSPNFRTIVNQALLKDERFERVSRGRYTVKGSTTRATGRKKASRRR